MLRPGPFLSKPKHSPIVVSATPSSISEALEKHRQAIDAKTRYRNRCNRCKANGGFTRHELRRRKVRVIVELAVHVISIVVARWRCSRCGHKFTDLPDFRPALPALREP